MSEKFIPNYIFETSWEVCNMVGGIYTVLSTRARILNQQYGDKLIFIGPDIVKDEINPYFKESNKLFEGLKEFTQKEYGLPIKIGRWRIPGNPVVILVDFSLLMPQKNQIYGHIWEQVGVNSLYAYGDYDESSMFGYASGMIVESCYRFFKLSAKLKVIAHFNEWMTSFGLFYVKEHLPCVATIFTTHATSIGRSIAGNNKPLYDYLYAYNGDQMAQELNMVSKHSTEKTAAHCADCFTAVSKITAKECNQLLEKNPDIITLNGFEDDFVPKGEEFTNKRTEARSALRKVTEALLGYKLQENALYVGTAGRYEYRNKGIDVFIDSLKRLSKKAGREVVAFMIVPAHVSGPRLDLAYTIKHPESPLRTWNHYTTHELCDYQNDCIMSSIQRHAFRNNEQERVKIVFIPSYVNGSDGIFNRNYYDLLIGLDLTVFPSYYEPWGYTPLESIAFSVPTITTDLSGFGQWISAQPQGILQGVGVIHRSDYNVPDVTDKIAEMIEEYASLDNDKIKKVRQQSLKLSKKALWENFIQYYELAYSIALEKKV